MKKIILILCFTFIYSFVYAQDASSNIKTLLSSRGKVLFGDEPNSIVVIDYPDNIERVAEYLATLDISPRQVSIEARVVEVKLQKEHSLGVNWQIFADKGYFPVGRFQAGTAALGTQPGLLEQTISYKNTYYPPAQTISGAESPFTFAIFDDNINIVLSTLASALDTNILSAPRVTTINNSEAEIKVIQKIPWAEPTLTESTTEGGLPSITWTMHFEEVGIALKVTPTINDDGNITMVLAPEVSEKTSDYPLTASQGTTSIDYTVPIIDTRSASTKVVVGSGQTLIIGGLIKDKSSKGATKIPLFGDIPFLGYLFKSEKVIKDKTELLIFVSPTIITPDEFVRMARQEKYGINRSYAKEDERQRQMLLKIEAIEKLKKDKLAMQLELLENRQKDIFEARKKLESDVSEEEESLQVLSDVRKTVFEERKKLEEER